MNVTLASALRSKQKQGSLSLGALAKAIGVSTVSVAAVLNGKSSPNKTTAAKYAKFLGLTAKAFRALPKRIPVVLQTEKNAAKNSVKTPVKTDVKQSTKATGKTASKSKAKPKTMPRTTAKVAASTKSKTKAKTAKPRTKTISAAVSAGKDLSLTELVALAGDAMALAVHRAPAPTRKVIEALLRS